MRNLCTIQKIKELEPIEGKDKIMFASFEDTGWRVIVDITEVKKGDLVVYCEYDTLLPPNPNFDFLRKRCWVEKYQGYRIRAMKMADRVSEGIVFPTTILPAFVKVEQGMDVTEIIGAKKYDPELEEEMKGQPVTKKQNKFIALLCHVPFIKNILYPKHLKGSWPTFFPPKTDETRIAAIPWMMDELKGKEVYITEKMDGQSFSVSYYKNKLHVCSRNVWYKNKVDNNYWNVVKDYDILSRLKKAKKKWGEIVIQGEICGPGIQGNKYGFKELMLFIFNIYSIDRKEYLSFDAMAQFYSDTGLKMVPLIALDKFQWTSIDDLTEYSKGNSVYNMDTNREGIVIRPVENIKGRNKTGPVFGCKVINPDFLVDKK